MKEIWNDIKGYEGLYQVSNFGNIKSLYGWNAGSKKYFKRNLIMKPKISNTGYYNIVLHKNKLSKTYNVHRLVAETFIPNIENKETVNHKDGNKLNNCINNLEWATRSENQLHAYNIGLQKPNKTMLNKKGKLNPLSKKVIQYDLNGNFIKEYSSYTEATQQTNINHIGDCCNGKIKRAGKYIWKWK